MKKSEEAVLWFFAIALIIPLSIDHVWKIAFSDFHFRPQYLSFALFALWALLKRTPLRGLQKEPYLKCVALLAASGLVGALFVSTYPKRAIAYWIWALGTMIALPTFLPILLKDLGRKVLRLMVAYVSVGVAVSTWDLLACRVGAPQLFIGLVNPPCRPHFYYQEPSYYAGFLLFVYMVFARHRVASGKWVAWIGLLVSGARMGWVGAILLALWESGRFLARAPRKSRLKYSIACLALLLASVPLAERLFPYSLSSITNPLAWSRERSSSQRILAAQAAWAVFEESPLVGSGPGSSGAYYIDKIPKSHPYHTTLQTWYTSRYSNQRFEPLANDLYSETLAEWGIAGFLLIGAIFALLIQRGARAEFASLAERRSFYVIALIAIGCTYTTCPTLARFDLWFCLAWISSRIRAIS